MTRVPIGEWTASIEPAEARATVTTALTEAANSTDSVSIALIRASRLLEDASYSVVLSNGEHIAALSVGHPAYFHTTEGGYRASTLPDNEEWRALPSRTILDLDYCGPTWMPLSPPTTDGVTL